RGSMCAPGKACTCVDTAGSGCTMPSASMRTTTTAISSSASRSQSKPPVSTSTATGRKPRKRAAMRGTRLLSSFIAAAYQFRGGADAHGKRRIENDPPRRCQVHLNRREVLVRIPQRVAHFRHAQFAVVVAVGLTEHLVVKGQ